MRILIESIPHSKQRYDTVGDYRYLDDGTLYITISEMGNEIYEKMVAIHELIEEALTKHRGLTEHQITDFDIYYEQRRKQGLIHPDNEVGFANDAPYLAEHTLATATEMAMCALAKLSWLDYDETVNNLK